VVKAPRPCGAFTFINGFALPPPVLQRIHADCRQRHSIFSGDHTELLIVFANVAVAPGTLIVENSPFALR
jgi:hypothetical protein